MASSYPGGLDAFTNPTASDTLDSATVPHAAQHSNANDAIEAIESTLGVNPQGSSATVVARLADLDSAVAGKAPATGIDPTAIAGTAVITTDARLSNTRVPTAHASTHGVAGSDPITVAPSQVTGFLATLAQEPELIVTGSITRNSSNVVTSAAVVWPDGVSGTYTSLTFDATTGAVNSYQITKGSATYTQPTLTRNSAGAVTNRPAIVVT